MRSRLASPRWRRRAARGAFVLLASAVAAGVAWIGRDGGREAELGRSQPRSAPAAPAPAAAGREVRFTDELRDAVLPVASRFVATAVERRRLDEAWRLVHPQLKRGYTLERWRGGDIPVVPYPVGAARWEVQYSLENEVALLVVLSPKPGADVDPTTFVLVLERGASGERWLVSAWVPSAGAAYAEALSPRPLAAVAPGGAFDQGNLSPLFLLLPVGGTIGTVVAVAAFFLVRGWRRNRRAAAAYGRRELPPLPSRYSSSS